MLARMRILTKCLLPVVLGCAGMVASYLFIASKLEGLIENQTHVVERRIPLNLSVRQLQTGLMQLRWATTAFAAAGSATARDESWTAVQATLGLIETQARTVVDLASVATTRQLGEDTIRAIAELRRDLDGLKAAAASGDAATAGALLQTRVTPTLADLSDRLDETATAAQGRLQSLTAQLTADTAAAERNGMIFVVATTILVLALGVAVAQLGIARPIDRLTSAMSRLAAGAWDTDVPGRGRGDELGAMAATVEVFKANGAENRRLAAERERQAEETARQRSAVDTAVARFRTAADSVIASLQSAAEDFERSIQSLSETAEQSSRSTEAAARSGAELTASIAEIGRQTTTSAQLSEQAVDEVGIVDRSARELIEASQRIGEVVRVISEVAEQTNLLALNATIEAARAGEAGRGFAVVAGEVKALAAQTSRATDDISQRIRDIQVVTDRAAEAIVAVNARITEIGGAATTIAGAVREQDATTRRIADGIKDAASGAAEVARSNGRLLAAATTVSRQTETLRTEFDQFVRHVGTA